MRLVSHNWISLSSPFTDLSLNFHTESEHKVKTKWIAVDFAKGREVYEQIEKELAGIEVGILGEFLKGSKERLNKDCKLQVQIF